MTARSSPGWWVSGTEARSTSSPHPEPCDAHHRHPEHPRRLRRRRPRPPGRRPGPHHRRGDGRPADDRRGVPHPGLPFPPPVAHHVDERRRADRAIRAVRDDLAPGARTVVVPGLSPAHAICKLADDEGASMIVVGSRHAAAERRMADADHALQVLRSTHAAVLVAPDDRPVSPTIGRIVVGFDDGAGSHDALATAIELARATGAHLHLLSVVPRESNAWWVEGEATVDPLALDRWVERRRSELSSATREALRERRRHRHVRRGPVRRRHPSPARSERRRRSRRPRLAALGEARARRARERLRARGPQEHLPDARGPAATSRRRRRRLAPDGVGPELTRGLQPSGLICCSHSMEGTA